MSNQIRVLAIEDEPLHEERLRMVLDKLGYHLIDVLPSAEGVIGKIEATHPDILLMDINLNSEMSGIDLLSKINEEYDIPSIFLTSFTDQDTFNAAKKVQPSAYLIKPYNQGELQRSIELAIFNKQKENTPSLQSSVQKVKQLFVKEGNSLVKVACNSIQLVKAFDKYCYIYTAHKRYMVKERLKNIQSCLPDESFLQVHRSYIVNFEFIESFNEQMNAIVILGQEIAIGRKYKQDLLSRIRTIG
ncbi:MAG: DNA-binding LytR/AlgR family response regulator [Roseivirga sp.]|jgi:DNA-binding LytR/AlgR family response regulator